MFHYRSRYTIVSIIFILALLALLWRVVDVMLFERDFLRGQGTARILRTVEIPSYRGMILDRNSQPLAISTPVKSVWLEPKSFDPFSDNITQLADLLDITVESIEQLSQQDRAFVYLARSLDPRSAESIEALNIPGVFFKNEFRRFYPEGEVAAHLLGFTNIDDMGQEGMELSYDTWLRGVPGKKNVLKDRLGRYIEDVKAITEPDVGNDLTLSIDRRIQYLVYRELKQVVMESQASSGSVVVLDPKTGEVLAMANYPSYNPNRRYKNVDERYRNRAVTDIFEPGSVSKAFTIASALSSGMYEPDTIIDTSPSWIAVDGDIIRDDRDNGKITVAQILQRSSNVGAAKMVLSLAPQQLPDLLYQFGFGQVTEGNFPGESRGILSRRANVKPFDLATMAFGYGLAVTPLQLVQGYSVFANQGRLVPVSLLRVDTPTQSKQVIDSEIAQQTLLMLESVVGVGTAKQALTPGYRVAGKTGTSRLVGDKGYDANRHVASFVGIAPVSDPRFVVAVVISEPKGQSYYGGAVAAPVFSRIVSQALKMYEIAPDKERA